MQVDLLINKPDAYTLNIQSRWHIMRILPAAIKHILFTYSGNSSLSHYIGLSHIRELSARYVKVIMGTMHLDGNHGNCLERSFHSMGKCLIRFEEVPETNSMDIFF